MARPIKHGLDYFPFDVDFFNDEKSVAIAGEFGIKGEIATVKLLCAVYRNGYYIEWTEMLKYKLLKELPGISPDLLDQIVKRLVKWDFFDKALFDSAAILTSKGIQRRYRAICAKMHRKNEVTEYSLLEDRPPARPQNAVPQSPAKIPKRVASPPPTAEVPASVLKPSAAPVPIEKSVAAMLSDTAWSEPVCMRYKLTPKQFRHKVENFKLHCLSRERREHKDVNDAKQHFCNLLSRGKLDDFSPAKPSETPSADYTYSGGFGGVDV